VADSRQASRRMLRSYWDKQQPEDEYRCSHGLTVLSS